MIPFVVASGILIAISVAFSGKPSVLESGGLKDIFTIGVCGFTLMVPIPAGFIAFSMAERRGIAPGTIGGYLAVQTRCRILGRFSSQAPGEYSGILPQKNTST